MPFYTQLTGNGLLTVDTMYCANFDHPTLKGCSPTYDLKDFRGRLVLINNQFARPFNKPPEEKVVGFRGACAGAELLTVNLTDRASFPPELPDGVTASHVNFRTGVKPDEQRGTTGTNDAAWVVVRLQHTLAAQPTDLAPLPAGVTGVRLFRVFTGDGRIGLHLTATGPTE